MNPTGSVHVFIQPLEVGNIKCAFLNSKHAVLGVPIMHANGVGYVVVEVHLSVDSPMQLQFIQLNFTQSVMQ